MMTYSSFVQKTPDILSKRNSLRASDSDPGDDSPRWDLPHFGSFVGYFSSLLMLFFFIFV